jgi:hypothetical protein
VTASSRSTRASGGVGQTAATGDQPLESGVDLRHQATDPVAGRGDPLREVVVEAAEHGSSATCSSASCSDRSACGIVLVAEAMIAANGTCFATPERRTCSSPLT